MEGEWDGRGVVGSNDNSRQSEFGHLPLLASPALKRASLVSLIFCSPHLLSVQGNCLRAPAILCHQMTQVTRPPLPQNLISINLAGGNFDLVRVEPFHF